MTCDSTTTTDTQYPVNPPSDRYYQGVSSGTPLTLTVNNGATVDGYGLAISDSGGSGINVTKAYDVTRV